MIRILSPEKVAVAVAVTIAVLIAFVAWAIVRVSDDPNEDTMADWDSKQFS